MCLCVLFIFVLYFVFHAVRFLEQTITISLETEGCLENAQSLRIITTPTYRTDRRYCTARQCHVAVKAKFIECSIINADLSLLMKHLVTGQRQKAPNFSAFHWSPHGSLVSIGQHFVYTKVVHLP